MDPSLIAELKSRLEEEERRLTGELSTFAVPDPKMAHDWDARFPASPGPASSSHSSQDEQADTFEEYETELAQEQSLESRLVQVRAALKRIGTESYGRCRACGEVISEERLGANPAAEYDIQHQPKE